MFLAHVPAGYLFTRAFTRDRRLLSLGMAASVVPDVDLFWFYFVDHRRHGHHSFAPHLPIFWVAVTALALLLFPKRRLETAVVCANAFLHLILDTVAGGIEWLFPFSRHSFVLFDVPATHSWWVWNFVFHPSFLLELALCVVAVIVYALRPPWPTSSLPTSPP